MLKCELDVMEYAVTMETEMLSGYEAQDFIDWLYDDFSDIFDITQSDLYKLCNSNIDCSIDNLNITIFDERDNELYKGKAIDYPYNWYDCKIFDYSTYNIGNEVYTDIWIK